MSSLNPPVIGVTTYCDWENKSHFLNWTYTNMIKYAGAIPVLLPAIGGCEVRKDYHLCDWPELDHTNVISRLDGLIFSGGEDVDPYYMGEAPFSGQGKIEAGRDEFELRLVESALDKKIPLLGICRGMQVINIAFGGTIYQDLPQSFSQVARQDPEQGYSLLPDKFQDLAGTTLLKHKQEAPRSYPTHQVFIKGECFLGDLVVNNNDVVTSSSDCSSADYLNARVNSFHHQGIKQLGKGLKTTAVASDGVVEAFEYTGDNLLVGVQWHPEGLSNHPLGTGLFKAFVNSIINER